MSANAKALPRLKILLVDDDLALLDLVSTAVESLGYDSVTATSSSDAIAILKENASRIALIVSDYQMPNATGFDLRRSMLPDYVDVPFIILSGVVTTEIALEAIDLKISAFLQKPFRIEQLKEAINKEAAARANAIREEDELLEVFVQESRDLADEMESITLHFEDGNHDPELINRLFACAHTIKGSSGYFKPATLNKFTHKFEDYIAKYRASTLPSSSVSVCLKAIDIIRELLNALESFKTPPPLESLIALFSDQPVVTPADAGDAHASGGSPKTETKKEELKVSAALVDDFIECGGELTVLRNMVNKNLRLVQSSHPEDPSVHALTMLLNEMYKINLHMQEQMSELRKVSVRHLVKPLSRTVRDLSTQLKKKIRFDVEGDDLMIEHSIADVLSKCLIHIVRNSADHGLEGPEDRQAAGKDAIGVINLRFARKSDNYVVSIIDDGRGINFDRVVAKSIENGLSTADEIARMPRSQVLKFIFEPGFSTAAVITDVSGRGVGTDMVKKSVEAAGGAIEIESENGRGSRFDLILPVPKSVMILNSLLVQAGSQTIAIPQSAIRRVTSLEPDDPRVQRVGSRVFFCEGELILPIVSLSDVFGESNTALGSLVWVEGKHGALTLSVDAIFEIEDTVVKKVANWFHGLNLFLGATFLADGRPGLVLDVEGLLKRVGLDEKSAAKVPTDRYDEAAAASLLLFDAGGPEQFAVEQSELFRLEECSVTDVQSVGRTNVLLYRERAMRLLDFDRAGFNKTRETWPLLVVEMDSNLYGIVVTSIQGFTSAQQSSIETSSMLTVDGKTFTLVRLRQWIASRIAPPTAGSERAA